MDTQAVYDNYRASLRAQRKADGGRGRSAARKQVALKVTADRYGIPIREVKALVRKLDEANGVTHEHTKQYSAELAFIDAYDLAKERLGDAPCSVCNIDHSSGLVRPRIANKLDLGEAWMADIVARAGGHAVYFSGTPKVQDFAQLCSQCKLHNLNRPTKKA
jgi:hypothetical protein